MSSSRPSTTATGSTDDGRRAFPLRWAKPPTGCDEVLEGMACAVPVIGSDIAGIAEALEHGHTGFLVPSADPRSIAVAARRLLRDPELRRRIGLAARAVSAGRAV